MIAGAPLRDLRVRLGLTSGELGKLLGVAAWWVTAAEQGVVLPDRCGPWLQVLSTWALPSDPYGPADDSDYARWETDGFDSVEQFVAAEGQACEAMVERMRAALAIGVVEAWASILGEL